MANGDDLRDYVTREELVGRLEPLGEIRGMLRESIKSLTEGQGRLSEELSTMQTEITVRMDTAYGRTAKAEAAIVAIGGKLDHISQYGCSQRASDIQVLQRLAHFNMEVPEEEVPLDPKAAFMKRYVNKRSAGIAALVGLGMFLMWAIPLIHKLFDKLGV